MMTTKQIAEVVGRPEKTVRNWVKKASDKMDQVRSKMDQASESKKAADYDLEETVSIIEVGLGKNAAQLYRENAKRQEKEITKVSFDNGMEDAFKALVRGFETLTEITRSQEARLQKIEIKIEERASLLPAPHIKPRDNVNKIVREYADKNKFEFRTVWKNLYTEFGYRTNSNPVICAKNRSMGILDYIDAEGQIELLESVAIDFLK